MMFDIIDQIRQYWLKNNLIDGSIIIFTQSRPITLYSNDFIYTYIIRLDSITILHPIFQKKKIDILSITANILLINIFNIKKYFRN